MTTTTLIVLNLLMSLVAMGGVAALVRLAHRLPERSGAETLHPSQPISLDLAREDAQTLLAEAA
ncbi:MAG TPA: hypothetical protein VHD91_13165 [Gaiellaceae bacterium]|nr:hypothetical protein [Gaiellaceae bacterium]